MDSFVLYLTSVDVVSHKQGHIIIIWVGHDAK